MIQFLNWNNLIRATPWPVNSFQIPKLQSHRGYHSGGLRENTMAAFQSAQSLGFQMIECDVRLSLDRVPVIFHDPDLQRLWGSETPVHRLEAQVLKDQYQIPTLEELLQDPHVPSFINIELKTKSASDPLIRKCAEVVTELSATSRVMFSSFNPFALWLLQDYLPEAPRALLVSDELVDDNAWWLRKMLAAPLLELHMLNFTETMLTPKFIEFWTKKNMPLSAWTVTDPQKGSALLEAGVRSLITDLSPREF